MATIWDRLGERVVDGVVIIDVHATRIGLSEGAERVFEQIQQTLLGGRMKVLLNLLEVRYIDSVGVSEIVRGHRAATDTGGTLKVCAVHPLRDVFVATKLDRYIQIFETERAALDSF